MSYSKVRILVSVDFMMPLNILTLRGIEKSGKSEIYFKKKEKKNLSSCKNFQNIVENFFSEKYLAKGS